jgi:uncharacterized protein (DUF488 family)
MRQPYFTIGHSTRTLDEFVDLLRASGIAMVADVRTVPRSRTNPQFNTDTLPGDLARFQIGYRHFAELGGLRGKQAGMRPSVNLFWDNLSFRNYADYALSDSFREGLAQLQELGQAQSTVIMCAEAVWWRCHRRIIADYLLWQGETVRHILGPGQIVAATLTPSARPVAGMGLIYDREGVASSSGSP